MRKKCEVTVGILVSRHSPQKRRGIALLRLQRELFTLEQYDTIRDRLRNMIQPLKLKRKISTADKKPIIYLPEYMVKAVNAKAGDEIDIYVEGKKNHH